MIKINCIVQVSRNNSKMTKVFMFMQTRLSGTERIMFVNKDLNNVNSMTGCLALDNGTFIYRFLTLCQFSSI